MIRCASGKGNIDEDVMLRLLLRTIAATAGLVALATLAHAETGFLDRSMTMNGRSFGYQVYVPREFTPAQTWPVVVTLHGGGSQGTDSLVPTVTGFGPAIRRDRSKFPAIVLFPQATPQRSWIDRDMQDLVMLQLEKTIEEFHGDRSRLYLTGFSMGGAGTYRMAHRWPNRFAALLVVAGPVESGVGTPAGSNTGVRDREVNPYTTAEDPFAALAAGLRAMPIWIFHGDADQTVPVEQSRRIAAALKKENARVEYTEYPGLSHGEAGAKALNAAQSIQWLLTQHQ
jgi:predicted peptidase